MFRFKSLESSESKIAFNGVWSFVFSHLSRYSKRFGPLFKQLLTILGNLAIFVYLEVAC